MKAQEKPYVDAVEDLRVSGVLTPERMADIAEHDESNALHFHPAFLGWDKDKLSHAQVLDVCRALIRRYVKFTRSNVPPAISRPILVVRNPALPSKTQGYVTLADLSSRRNDSIDALLNALRDIRSYTERAAKIATQLPQITCDLTSVLHELDVVVKHVTSQKVAGKGRKAAG